MNWVDFELDILALLNLYPAKLHSAFGLLDIT